MPLISRDSLFSKRTWVAAPKYRNSAEKWIPFIADSDVLFVFGNELFVEITGRISILKRRH